MVTVIIFLGILSTMLIYSLMLQDVNSKTYEFGMLRALGFRLTNLVEVVLLKSLSFSIPGFLTGVMIAAIVNIMMREVIYGEGGLKYANGVLRTHNGANVFVRADPSDTFGLNGPAQSVPRHHLQTT